MRMQLDSCINVLLCREFFHTKGPGKQRERFDGQSGPDLAALVAESVVAISGQAGTKRCGPTTHANWKVRIVQKMQGIGSKPAHQRWAEASYKPFLSPRKPGVIAYAGVTTARFCISIVRYQIPVLHCYC